MAGRCGTFPLALLQGCAGGVDLLLRIVSDRSPEASALAASPDSDSNEIWNFRTLLSQGTFVNISYQFASANVVLPFIYLAVGAPVLFAGLILPIVQIANLVSPLVGAPLLRASPFRKWYLVLCVIIVAAAMSVIGLAAHSSEGKMWLVAVFLIVAGVVGISQGLSGMAFNDLIGRVLPQHRRSHLLFAQAGLAGVFTIVIAFGSQHLVEHTDALDEHLEMLWIGIVVMILSCFAAVLIRETPASSSPKDVPLATHDTAPRIASDDGYIAQMKRVLRERWYRRYLVMRAFLLSIELATPFYALHAATQHADKHGSLSVFVIASSAALVVSGLVWRRVSDFSVRLVLRLAATLACLAGLLAIATELVPEIQYPWAHGVVFFLIVTARQGSSNARTLYVVNLTNDWERPYFLAISSVLIGALATAVAFAFGALAHLHSAIWPVWCIVAVNAVAFFYTWRLVEGREPQPDTVFPGTTRN